MTLISEQEWEFREKQAAELRLLYEERATLVSLESDIQDTLKHVRVGGFMESILNWILRGVEKDRKQTQEEIDVLWQGMKVEQK